MYTWMMVASFVVIFCVAANHESLGGMKWAGISLGLSILFVFLLPNMFLFGVSQIILFVLLWRANVQKRAQLPAEFARRKEEMRLERLERVRQSRAQHAREQLEEERKQD